MKVSGITLSAISQDVRRSKSVVSRILKLCEETKGLDLKKAATMRDDRTMKRPLHKQLMVNRMYEANCKFSDDSKSIGNITVCNTQLINAKYRI
ncbi:Hypothetical predicted protein [Octopus vulgaris]|uniref:Uncharacterized protein n=1 Tax=Octopus vulgaris TaxID=6645 RepID=A0AA36B544_OCTVU|nr:Hypothetical predicted protein [Octopus vulgaris]